MLMTSSIKILIGAMTMSTQFGEYLDKNERWQYSNQLLVLLTAVFIAIILHTVYVESKA
jgi:hypothetical protein